MREFPGNWSPFGLPVDGCKARPGSASAGQPAMEVSMDRPHADCKLRCTGAVEPHALAARRAWRVTRAGAPTSNGRRRAGRCHGSECGSLDALHLAVDRACVRTESVLPLDAWKRWLCGRSAARTSLRPCKALRKSATRTRDLKALVACSRQRAQPWPWPRTLKLVSAPGGRG
jgi:hypothetical protein